MTTTSPTKRVLKDLDDDEIEELKVAPEVDTSGDLEYALMLDELLKEKEEKRAQAKHKQQRNDELLAQEMQMRVAEEERNSCRKPTPLKVIEISSSDSDQDGHVVVKQEAASGTAKRKSAELVKRARLATPSPHPPRITATHEEDQDSPMKHKKVVKVTKHKKEKKRGSEEGKTHKHKHAKKKLAYSISPPPSVSPPSVSPPSVSPPSVSPPSVSPPMKPAAAGKNKPLPVKRGRKSRHNWTIDEYLHMANTLSAPRFETPTVALRTLHRGHLLLDITSANVLRNAWQHLRTGVTSPLHDPRTASALEATEQQLEEIRKKAREYERHQIIQQEQSDQPVEPLIAEQMEARAVKEKQVRKDTKEARGESVGKALLKASQELVQATKDAMKMYGQLHARALQHVEDNYGHLSSSSEGEQSSSDFEDGSSESD